LKMGQTLPGNNDAIKIIQLNLGFLFCHQGKFEDAERVLAQSLDEDPDQPMVLYPLGNTYLGLGKVDEGLAAHLKALKLYIERFGPQHAISGVSMFKVGQILFQQKKEPYQAIPYLRRSLECYQAQDCHYYTKTSVARGAWMLAKALKSIGVEEEGESLFKVAWDLKKEVSGLEGSTTDSDDDYTALMFYWDQ